MLYGILKIILYFYLKTKNFKKNNNNIYNLN